MAGLFQILWGGPSGEFQAAEPLVGTDGEPLIIPIEGRSAQTENICTRPTAIDWDSDGDLDLVVGNFAGSFYLFTGLGNGKFEPTPQPIMSGDEPLRISGVHSDPFLIDWDGDGDIDILSGSGSGGVQWSENTAGVGKPPQLSSFQTLIDPGDQVPYNTPTSENDLTGPASSTRIWADDVNNDGKLDLLVGDSVTLISIAEGLTLEQFEQKHTEWQKAVREASAEMNSVSDDQEKLQEALKRIQSLYASKADFMTEERTGFVWLYLQK